ncbi:MAG: DnaB-like helicase C-terminal domain-containing protein [Deltaproteobacteria bacterium]|nr:DnaB-like helicase C-terminal domain-containing protein [Deltaproteobacteria bacterium]MDZ4346278.1 DnaB-like helicase C-terminal domain-containing protein [Candidatus Binatia bacterium]
MLERRAPACTPMADAVVEFQKEMDSQTEADFFLTGFPSHDQALGRLRRGSLTLVGARPSMGKTSFMLCAALAQMKAGITVYFFSLEMPRGDMIGRLVSIETGISLLDILQRRYNTEQAREIVGVLPILSPLPGNWSDEDNLKRIGELFGTIKPGSRSIVYVDFLGLVQVTGLDAAQQYAVTTEVGLALKRAAMGLQIPVVVGVQLNRQSELRKEKQPLLSDFRDSGRLEEIGDVCLGLHRPGFYEKNIPDTELQVFCLKNRNGPRVNYVLSWNGPCARAAEKAKSSWTEVA